MTERHVLLVVARARADWSAGVARWSASAVLPVEVVRCVSLDEAVARLRSGRPHSALLVDAGLAGLDRDLVDTARRAGCATLVVDDGRARDLATLGADALLRAPFSRDELLRALDVHARPVAPGHAEVVPGPRGVPARTGHLVAVTGPGGTGASTAAIALAQGLAGTVAPRRRRTPRPPAGDVLLADLCRRADQAVLHDARDLVPGLRELVEAHRTVTPDPAVLRRDTFEVVERGYRLLLGLRRPHHWAALQPRAVDATLDGLLAAFEVVVADVDPDVEGEDTTGSYDVEERHHLARTTLTRADVAMVVGEPSLKGTHALVRLVTELVAAGVDPARLLLVLTRVPRQPRVRAEVVRALADLLGAALGGAATAIASPLGLPTRPVDAALRDGTLLPSPLPERLAAAVRSLLAPATSTSGAPGRPGAQVSTAEGRARPLVPGELGTLPDGTFPDGTGRDGTDLDGREEAS